MTESYIYRRRACWWGIYFCRASVERDCRSIRSPMTTLSLFLGLPNFCSSILHPALECVFSIGFTTLGETRCHHTLPWCHHTLPWWVKSGGGADCEWVPYGVTFAPCPALS